MSARVFNSFTAYALGSFFIAPELINPYYNIYMMKNRNPGAFNADQDSGETNLGSVMREGFWNGIVGGFRMTKSACTWVGEAFAAAGEDNAVEEKGEQLLDIVEQVVDTTQTKE